MQRLDRRTSLLGFAAAVVAPAALLACGKKPLNCQDTSALKPDEIALRGTLGYEDISKDAQKKCSNCQFFKPAGENQCGGCQLLKGPINPSGLCKSWVQKKA
jgi:hypothetical protein